MKNLFYVFFILLLSFSAFSDDGEQTPDSVYQSRDEEMSEDERNFRGPSATNMEEQKERSTPNADPELDAIDNDLTQDEGANGY